MVGKSLQVFLCGAFVISAPSMVANSTETHVAQAQDRTPFVGVWQCRGTMYGAPFVYDVVLQPNGSYSGTLQAASGYAQSATGPWRLIGNILRFDYATWQTFPKPTTNPGGDGYYYKFQGQNMLLLTHYRCPENPECNFGCRRMG